MRNLFLILLAMSLVLMSCKSTKSSIKAKTNLEGTWELNYLSGTKDSLKALYPNVMPFINFNLKENSFSGSNGCNRFTGQLVVEGNKIDFKKPKLAMTNMVCQGEGDYLFMTVLEKINSYSISNDGKILNFIMGDIAIMRFEKK